MAGESPDKSDKKQSSGETARNERDPRLSVLRGEPAEPAEEVTAGEGEDVNPSAPSEESEASGTSGASEPDGDAEAPEASDGVQKPAGDEEAPEAGDERLRSAVAAWVAGKGDEERAETDDASAKPEGERGSDAGAEAAADPEGDAAAGAESGADDPEGGDKPAPKDSADEPKAKSEAKAKPEAKSEAKPEPKAKPEAKVKPKAKPEARAKSEPKSEVKAKSEGKAKAEVVDQPTAVFKTVGPQKSKPVEAADEEDGADGSAVDDATRVFAVAKLKAKGASADTAAPVDQATTALKINPPAKSPAKSPAKAATKAAAKDSDSKKDSDSEKDSETGPAKDSGKDSAKDPAKDSGKSEKAKDAEKDSEKDSKDSGKDGKDSGKDGKGGSKAAPAESDAERTSQFVALKSADDGTAGKSLGKTAPRTPLGTPGKPTAKADEKATGKTAEKPAGKAGDKTTDKAADKAADKAGAKEKASGALPAGASAAPPKPAGRPGALPPAAPTDAAAPARPEALPESERTKQQPLPPLDLLAKLTNTPPPPETPLRTVVRRFKIWTPLVVLLAIIFVIVQGVRPLPNPELAVGDATSFTFKGGTLSMPWPDQGQAAAEVVGVGRIGSSGAAKPVPTASVAKVMTAYVILRDHPLKKGEKGETITIDAQGEADSQKKDESRVPLKKDQQFTQYQMLQMLMIPSGNNVARQLARWDASSEEAFVKKMNAAAKKLGMTKTTYTDPSGLDKATVSTAVDQLKLAEQVMKNDAFREVVRTENVQIAGLPEKIYNNNRLLTTMAGQVAGIKTGSSSPAGGTFMWASYRTVGGKDQLILGVTMDQHTNSPDPNAQLDLVLNNTQKVITAARGALVSDTVVKKGQVVGYVDDGLGGQTPVVATKDLSAVGWPGMKATFSMSTDKTLPHEAKAGTKVGVLTVGNGASTQKVPVALKDDLVEPTFGAKLTRIG
ncbi:hypothetical protein HEK616_00670 [Streptomyces nigrescens]|uniref:serine-type D-Ala-D-Ala carboxypeptidase n=1 Tax=Streptomyces nigrescens TaxID=1920 RepID=A0ABM7ZJQ3_STRNI|nr:serine hydrolase [Streptomyces nigrescens]BDM66580.1 hypothetical protein HEK616_00670 [Streptomyces nigrescens]